ncbi:MAG: hypothetical protein AB7E36_17515 [Salinivirgaceae bacterium]
MLLDYKTNRLPLNFIILGYMLLAIGIWRIIVIDWKGIFFLLLAVFLIFYKSGILIDTDKKWLRTYNGILFVKKGQWKNINQLSGLQILKSKESQTMSVLSISRTEIKDTYKLYLNLPDRNILLMKGNKNDILEKGKIIASSLQTSLIYNKK